MRVIFMGRKPVACKCLEYLIEKGIDVVVVVSSCKNQMEVREERLDALANRYGIPVTTESRLYNAIERKVVPEYGFILRDIDLVLSILYPERIMQSLIDYPLLGCINFHPAPLPEYRGVGGYNFAIYENREQWGVSAHYIDTGLDTGDLIKVSRFDINSRIETAFSLEQLTQSFLLKLFKEIMNEIIGGHTLPRIPQGKGRYISYLDLEQLKRVTYTNTLDEIQRKIRACWYPPYDGATIDIGGESFTLVSKDLLREISRG